MRHRPTWRILGYAVALATSLGVFMLYLQPDFMVQMAQQVWACF